MLQYQNSAEGLMELSEHSVHTVLGRHWYQTQHLFLHHPAQTWRSVFGTITNLPLRLVMAVLLLAGRGVEGQMMRIDTYSPSSPSRNGCRLF